MIEANYHLQIDHELDFTSEFEKILFPILNISTNTFLQRTLNMMLSPSGLSIIIGPDDII